MWVLGQILGAASYLKHGAISPAPVVFVSETLRNYFPLVGNYERSNHGLSELFL